MEASTAPAPLTVSPARGAVPVSVVICAYTERRWDQMLAAVASITAQTASPLETVVVADHNPRLAARLRAAAPSVRVIENGGERGLSAARNVGVEAARGEIVAFLDDDAVADPARLG